MREQFQNCNMNIKYTYKERHKFLACKKIKFHSTKAAVKSIPLNKEGAD